MSELGMIEVWDLLHGLEAWGFSNVDVVKALAEQGAKVTTDSGSIEDFEFITTVDGFTQEIDEKIRLEFGKLAPSKPVEPPKQLEAPAPRTEAEPAKQLALGAVKDDSQLEMLYAFLNEMYEFNRFWAGLLVTNLSEQGVAIVTIGDAAPGAMHPNELVVESCSGLTKEAIAAVRQKYTSEEWVMPKDEKKEVDKTHARKLELQEIERQRIADKKRLKEMTEQERNMTAEELHAEWNRLNSVAKTEGFPKNYISDLFNRVCKQLGCEPELSFETILALRANVEKEVELKNRGRAADTQFAPPPVKQELASNPCPPEIEKQVAEAQAEVDAKADKHKQRVDEIFGPEPVAPGTTEAPKPAAPEEADHSAQDATVATRASGAASEEKPKRQRAKKGDEGAKETPTNNLENILVPNISSGEMITFNLSTKRWFDLQIKKLTIEAEAKAYADQCQARMNEVLDQEKGWSYCYMGGIGDVVREQFQKQQKPDGTFKPATVKTEYCTFSRDPQDAAVVIDNVKLQAWAEALPEEERIFFGDIIEVVTRANKKEAVKALGSGQVDELPGVIKIENPDPIGTPKLGLSTPRNTNTKAAENSEAKLELVENNEEAA